MTDWVNGSCSATCGTGTLQSTRTAAHTNLYGGNPCPNDTVATYDCIITPCPIGMTIVYKRL